MGMKPRDALAALVSGWAGGLVGNALLGVLFSSGWARSILYDPNRQSDLFLTVTPLRNVPVSVVGLIVLGGLHGVAYVMVRPVLPGIGWIRHGFAWGVAMWVVYWIFQEWFVYVTLLAEPVGLALFELVLLLAGSILNGLVLAGAWHALSKRNRLRPTA